MAEWSEVVPSSIVGSCRRRRFPVSGCRATTQQQRERAARSRLVCDYVMNYRVDGQPTQQGSVTSTIKSQASAEPLGNPRRPTVWRIQAVTSVQRGRWRIEINFGNQIGNDVDLGKLVGAGHDFAAACFHLCGKLVDIKSQVVWRVLFQIGG